MEKSMTTIREKPKHPGTTLIQIDEKGLAAICFGAAAMVYVLIFCYGPMYGLQIAFKDFTPSKGFDGSVWIGFQHFRTLFSSYQFGR